MYYKIIINERIVGVASERDFRTYQEKHKLVLMCGADTAQYICSNGNLYHGEWMKGTANSPIQYIDAEVLPIEETEYEVLKKSFDDGKTEMPIVHTEMATAEYYEMPVDQQITLESVKDMKINEMSEACRNSIIGGAYVDVEEGLRHFSFAIEDQMKLQVLAQQAQNGTDRMPWHSDDEFCKFYSARDILAIYHTLEQLQTYHTTYFNSLKKYIESMTSIEEISNIRYGQEIPQQYQSEVFRYLVSEGR